jgi:hypothetical protein
MYKTIGLALFLAACSPVAMPANDAGNMDAMSSADGSPEPDGSHASDMAHALPTCHNAGASCSSPADCCPASELNLPSWTRDWAVTCDTMTQHACIATWVDVGIDSGDAGVGRICPIGQVRDCHFDKFGAGCSPCHP